MRRTAVITGVCGGIGSATASYFSDRGWQVIGLDVQPEYQNDDISRYLSIDLSNPSDVREGFGSILETVDQVHTLVNNAAIQLTEPLMTITTDEWDLVIATNVRAALLCSQHVYPVMKSEGGTIVNVSSVHALATSEGKGAYAASKGALVALTRSLALELAIDSIRVNAILPGAVNTPMLRPGAGEDWEKEALQQLVDRTPLQRVAEPKEIAAMIHFLASDDSSFVTGQAFVVDGGVLARLATE